MTTLNNHLRDLLVDQGLDNLFVVALVELSPANEPGVFLFLEELTILSKSSRADFGGHKHF